MTKTTGREAAIDGLHRYRKELLNQLRQVEMAMVAIGGPIEEDGTALPVVTHNDLKTKDLGPQQIVENSLRESPDKSFRPRLLAKRIVEGGYQPTSPKVWPNQVTNCLKRAVAKGIAEETTGPDGKKRYKWKQGAETKPTENSQLSVQG